MELVNKIGPIDSTCSKCYNRSLIVYAGAPESFPGAEKVCECGHIEKANLTEIRAAREFAKAYPEDSKISEVVEVIEDNGITCFVVPDSIVEILQLKPGDKFKFSFGENGELIAKPEINRVNN